MSKTHWELFSTNALEAFNTANNYLTKEERREAHRKQRVDSFKWQLELNRMKPNKPKRNYDKEKEDSE